MIMIITKTNEQSSSCLLCGDANFSDDVYRTKNGKEIVPRALVTIINVQFLTRLNQGTAINLCKKCISETIAELEKVENY